MGKAWDLYPVIVGLMQWGTAISAILPAPVRLVDGRSGLPVIARSSRGVPPPVRQADIRVAPGSSLKTLAAAD